jgi:hypothetical protein
MSYGSKSVSLEHFLLASSFAINICVIADFFTGHARQPNLNISGEADTAKQNRRIRTSRYVGSFQMLSKKS